MCFYKRCGGYHLLRVLQWLCFSGYHSCVGFSYEPVKMPSVTASSTPQWGAADAEIKVPSVENTELKGSPSKARSRSVYSHTCYAYCQRFLSGKFLPFRSIHLHYLTQNLSRVFPVLVVANNGSCEDPQNTIGHSAGCRFPC